MKNKNRKKTFFEEDTEHGRVKRIMLKKYLQPYIEKTQSEKYTLRTLIIDGFAGVGRYGKEWPCEIEKYGSPLIALMVALGVGHRKAMKELKMKNETQKLLEEISALAKSEEDEIMGSSEKIGNQESSHEREAVASDEIETYEILENTEKQGEPENIKTLEMSGDSGTHTGLEVNEMSEGCKTQSGPEGSGARSELETLEHVCVGGECQECMETKLNKDSGGDSLWGWPASEYAPEDELAYELEQFNRRKSLSVKRAKIVLMFIESDPESYKKLAANVELLIIKFLKRCYPSYEYGFSSAKGKVWLDLGTGPFSISVKIVGGKFAETEPPSMLFNKLVRSFTFLDPFGYTHTPMSHIAKFARGTGNEVFINFMSSFVNRFVSRNTEGVVQLYGMSDYENVAKLYGIDLPDLENENDLAEFVQYVIRFCQPELEQCFSNEINKCTSNYEAFLKRKTNSMHSLTFEVKDKGNTTIYHMIHITNHIEGVKAMKESMNRCSQREGEMIMSEYDIVRQGQKLNLRNLDDPVKVAETIFDEFRGKREVKLDIIQNYILFETKYLFRKKPLKILQKAGKIMEVVDTEGKPQRRRYQFPCQDKTTEEPIVWLISFADEEYTAENPNSSSFAEAERRRKREERIERARKIKEQKERKKILKKEKQKERMIQREKRRKEIEEKKKKMEEKRALKKRKKEERRRHFEEMQRKKKEAKIEKERKKYEAEKRKEEKQIEEMKSQKLITSYSMFSKLDSSQRLTDADSDGDRNRKCDEAAPTTMENTTGTFRNNGNDDRGLPITEEQTRSGKKKGQKKLSQTEEENNKKANGQRRITDSFQAMKGVEIPVTTTTKKRSGKTNKRKLPDSQGNNNNNAKVKRKDGASDMDHDTGSSTGREKNPSQKVLTDYFQRQENSKM